MSNDKQSSVEWLLDQITYNNGYGQRFIDTEDLTSYFEQAKAMHKEEVDQSYRDGFEFALINECAKQSTSDASKYAEGYSEGYKRALELVEWGIEQVKAKK
jgi:hypothetical protein